MMGGIKATCSPEALEIKTLPVDLPDYLEIARIDPGLDFLIICGYAVAAHGHARATFDVDFLAAKEDRLEWTRRLLDHGFKIISETSSFVQFTPPNESTGLDLMFVEKNTFDQFLAASEQRAFGTAHARIPSLDHLLALKLHVLKQGLAHRTFKDAQDLEMLGRRNKLKLDEEHCEKLFLNMEPRKSTKLSSGSLEMPELRLPVDTQFHSLPPEVTLEDYCRLNKEFRSMFPQAIPTEEERLARKTSKMFEF